MDEIVELRRYTLHPGARETLIELFEAKLITPQEDAGMHVIGQFRDLDQPDHFVWLRGFRDMAARDRGLRAFYGGSVWERHKDAANATMIDSDDVLLLRVARRRLGLADGAGDLGPNGEPAQPALFLITEYPVAAGAEDALVRLLEHDAAPAQVAAGAELRAIYRSEESANTFPALPVREGENVVVTVCAFSDRSGHAQYETLPNRSQEWGRVPTAWPDYLEGPPKTARLAPTARSRLHR